jgi:hypothetical protein
MVRRCPVKPTGDRRGRRHLRRPFGIQKRLARHRLRRHSHRGPALSALATNFSGWAHSSAP